MPKAEKNYLFGRSQPVAAFCWSRRGRCRGGAVNGTCRRVQPRASGLRVLDPSGFRRARTLLSGVTLQLLLQDSADPVSKVLQDLRLFGVLQREGVFVQGVDGLIKEKKNCIYTSFITIFKDNFNSINVKENLILKYLTQTLGFTDFTAFLL